MKKHYLLIFCLLLVAGRLFSQDVNDLKLRVEKGSIQMATDDGQFKFGIGGRIFMDAAAYFDDKTDLGSGSEIRDARLLFKATVWKDWDAKINIGFDGGNASLKDVFLQYNINTNSFFRAGHFLEPFGIEQTESSKTIKFMNFSSTVEAFRPGRNLGVSYDRWGKNYYWALGLFGSDVNNTVSNQDEDFGITSRLVVSPFHKENIMHFGLSGTYRSVNSVTIETNNGYGYSSTETTRSVRYRSRTATHIEGRRFIDVTVDNAESQFKFGIEMIAASGLVAFQSELINSKVNVKKDYSSDKDYKAKGWYMQFGFLLKGGNYKYNMKSARLAKPEPGSLELLARVNETDLNDEHAFIRGGKQKDISLGCTWYVNHNVLMKLNFTNVDLDENALNGEENFNMIQTRLQFSF
ncbi:OprO/OprP family phosphate-selective porin [Labilibaculum euxinus]